MIEVYEDITSGNYDGSSRRGGRVSDFDGPVTHNHE
jgi:hypothetical protein